MKNLALVDGSAAIATRNHSAAQRQFEYSRESSGDDFLGGIANDHCLAKLLGFEAAPEVEKILTDVLFRPVTGLTSNPGKRIRAQLVSFSYRLLNGDRPPSAVMINRCHSCAEAIELIHAGSLIIDDIEDGSAVRRGRPALHKQYGTALALNAGNWLYFWPAVLLKDSELSEDDLLLIYEHYHRTLLRAHFGQALDLGARVDTLTQDAVVEVCLASMRLKTGALMGFAALLGAALADTSEALISALNDFGCDLGVALQMFDDLGNVIGICEPAKRYEDLTLSRPSWVWACAAQNSSPAEYKNFIAAARKLPEAVDLEEWMDRHALLRQTRQSARAHLNRSFDNLKTRLDAEHVRWSKQVFDELCALGDKLTVAYG